MNQKKYLLPFSLSVFIPALLLVGFSWIGLIEFWNRKLTDSFFSILPSHHRFSKDVVIIDIDEHSLARYANDPELGRWPWKRSVYPLIFDFLYKGGPKLGMVDILFTEYSQDDLSLAEANLAFPFVSHAVQMREDREAGNEEPRNIDLISKHLIHLPPETPFPVFEAVSFPSGEIGATSPFIHTVNVIPDADGVLRRFPPVMRVKNYHLPTVALQGFSKGEPMEVGWEEDQITVKKENTSTSFPLEKGGLIRSYFYSKKDLSEIPRYSAGGVLESLTKLNEGVDESELIVSPSVFTDKIVLIGTSAAATHDDVVTPFGLYPGVIAQAVFISNLLEGHVLEEIEDIYGFIFALVLLLISTYVLFFSTHHWLRIACPVFATLVFLIAFYIFFRNDFILPPAPFVATFPVSYLLGFAYLNYIEGIDKRKYNNILRNLVDPEVVSHALEDLESLKKGGEWEITAFFSDVAGFSSISEELSASELARLLNEYLSAMTVILKFNSGTLDKYIGDAIVGIFGAPLKNESHPILSCQASLEMISKLKELKAQWKEKNDYSESARNMKIRIGLNCGPAKVGFMGTDSLASYTMMGDTVNLASRLEAAAKDYGVDILVSESIEEKGREHFHFRFLDRIRVKGKEAPVKIYGLIGKKSDVSEAMIHGEAQYRKAFDFYSKQNWKDALEAFEKAMTYFGKDDAACQLLIKRCEVLFQSPPSENWDGVYTRTSK